MPPGLRLQNLAARLRRVKDGERDVVWVVFQGLHGQTVHFAFRVGTADLLGHFAQGIKTPLGDQSRRCFDHRRENAADRRRSPSAPD